MTAQSKGLGTDARVVGIDGGSNGANHPMLARMFLQNDKYILPTINMNVDVRAYLR